MLNSISKYRKWLIITALAALAWLILPGLDFLNEDNILRLAELPTVPAAIVFLLLYALQGAIMVVPTGLLYIGAGLAFPTWLGILITYTGLTVSLSVGYIIGARLGEEKVNKMLSKNKKVSDFLNGNKDNLLFLSFISRLLPTPFGLVSLFFGALKVPFPSYIFMSLLGLSPFMIPVVFAGAAITNPFSREFIIPFIISFVITFVIYIAYKKQVVTKTRITVLLLVAQVLLFAGLINRMLNAFPIIALGIYLFSIFMVLMLVKKNETAAYKVIWIIVIIALPISGAILYLLFGINHPAKRVAAHMKEHAVVAKLLDGDNVSTYEDLDVLERSAGIMHYIRKSSAYHHYENTETTYYPMGELMFEAMLLELQKAEKFIFIEYFIISKSYMWDKILEILLEKAKAGVDVRLIFDDIGSLGLFNSAYMASLGAQGIKIMRFNPIVPFISPFMNNRNHRKIMVIDGHTGFNGGINISDEYINLVEHWGVWKDTGIMLKGEAVWSFTLMFIETWNAFCKNKDDRINDYIEYKYSDDINYSTDGLIIPYGDSPLEKERLGENIYIDILSQAEKYVYIFSPYLIISEKMIYAMQMAAKRGVDIRIVTPGVPDKKIVYRLTRSYYGDLLEAGVRIYEYTPGFLHAKSFVCDDKIAVVGSINLDYRSLYLHFECATFLYKAKAIGDIKDDAVKSIALSREISQSRKQFYNEFFDAVLHLFAPLM
ncbi:MAG: cardiolipin synthase [Defluviitaleaceae bacterium]|nr:cardiolipin synthase [Defluviitaleaceae bacterium]